jgi:hypothetical protein
LAGNFPDAEYTVDAVPVDLVTTTKTLLAARRKLIFFGVSIGFTPKIKKPIFFFSSFMTFYSYETCLE